MSVSGTASSSDAVPRPRSSGPTSVAVVPWTCRAKTMSPRSTPKAAAARARLVDHVAGTVADVQPEVERPVGGLRHATVPRGHGHRGPAFRRLVPVHQGDGGRVGHGAPTIPSTARRGPARAALRLGGLALVPHGGGHDREERARPTPARRRSVGARRSRRARRCPCRRPRRGRGAPSPPGVRGDRGPRRGTARRRGRSKSRRSDSSEKPRSWSRRMADRRSWCRAP